MDLNCCRFDTDSEEEDAPGASLAEVVEDEGKGFLGAGGGVTRGVRECGTAPARGFSFFVNCL